VNTTDNYGLKKPEYSDYADIEILNENFDTLDEELHNAAVEASMDASTKTVLTDLGWSEGTLQKIGSAIKFFGQKLGANPSTLITSAKTIVGSINEICNNVIADGAAAHNAIYRGKSLGTSVSSAQWTAISNGKFTDMFIGDYWTIGGKVYRIAHFDYWLNCGDTACSKHHIVIVPDANMYSAQMHNTSSGQYEAGSANTTEGGYTGSDMYRTNLAQAKSTINSAFGSAHILNHRELLTNAVTNGYASGGAWMDSTVELMTEQMVYGGKVFGDGLHGTNIPYSYTIDFQQLALFRLDKSKICNRSNWWLRDVASAASFCVVYGNGYCTYDGASYPFGVRPAFGICA